jgi:GDP-L-fucose synthase
MRWKVVIVDNMMSESALPFRAWPGHLKCDRNLFEFHKADCRDFFKSPDGNRNFDLFIHLAAVVGGRSVIEGAPLHIADDLSIDAAAFQWAIDDDLKSMPGQMIYFSSSAAYPVKYQGDTGHFSLSENMIDLDNVEIDLSKPDLTYGWAKLTGEYLAKLAHSSYGLNVSVYRPMSGYGEDQHEAYPFKSIVKKGLKRLDPIPIWSNAVRDFIHIEDIVNCVINTMFDLKMAVH